MVVLLTAPTGVLAEWGAHSFGFLSALLFPKNNSHIEVEFPILTLSLHFPRER